ncbi:hypothetical protein [Streptomyces sp. NRRL B-24484]|uniref:hypothetical protein n=1 Tax=Streptomyces sp. NRRL B-24484 TaxID=1463833 RepID=UPI001F2C3B9B|nr:hypothetical protein [Streptomyces sp. NRRL B-24484]
MAFSAAALGVHSTAKAAGANVSWQTLAIDGMGVVPVVGALGKAGKLAMEAKTIDRAVTAGDTSGKFAIGASLHQWSLDLSGLRQMMPRDGGQAAQNVPIPGGAFITGLQNAWKDGAQKDAARAAQNG